MISIKSPELFTKPMIVKRSWALQGSRDQAPFKPITIFTQGAPSGTTASYPFKIHLRRQNKMRVKSFAKYHTVS